jgi:polygalacturonase
MSQTTLIKRSVLTLFSALLLGRSATLGAEAFSPAQAANAGPKDSYNIRGFGAVGDGKSLDSPSINLAIEACAKAGGGTVYVPPGIYLCGSIHLKSHIHLDLDEGATILGAPQDMKAYDPAEPFDGPAYQDGGHTYFHNSLIWGEDLTNVSITGLGRINGGGLVRSSSLLDRISGFSNFGKSSFSSWKASNTDEDSLRVGNKAIALKRCRHVLLRDVTIFHGGHFAILLTGCDDMTIDNVTIDTNRDGMDIDCCRNTTVSNCRVNSPFDDGICPKSSHALGKPVITENLTIVNCQVSGFEEGTFLDGTMKPSKSKNGRIKFGTEANGGFRNCTVANCTFRACKGLALEEVDGGILENITINNLTMMETAQYPIYITLGQRNRGPGVTQPGKVRNVFVSNVIATGIEPMSGIQITGLPGYDVENVRLDNIRLVFNGGGTKENAARVPPELDRGYPEPSRLGVMPAYGLFARHVRGLELANIRMSFEKEDLRPVMVCDDVDGLEIENFKAQTAEGVVPVKFESVKGLVVRNSPMLGGEAGK